MGPDPKAEAHEPGSDMLNRFCISCLNLAIVGPNAHQVVHVYSDEQACCCRSVAYMACSDRVGGSDVGGRRPRLRGGLEYIFLIEIQDSGLLGERFEI